jgi:hypothetical protein
MSVLENSVIHIESAARAHISGRQTLGLTRGSPPNLLYKKGGEPRVEPGVWRPEMWALIYVDDGIFHRLHVLMILIMLHAWLFQQCTIFICTSSFFILCYCMVNRLSV